MTDTKAPILQIPAYRTLDGKQFYDLAEAQAHTRDGYLHSIVKGLQKEDPKFARLNEDLLVEALKRIAPRATTVINDALEPVGPADVYAEAAVAAAAIDPRKEKAVERIITGTQPAFEAPYGRGPNPDIFQNADTFPAGGIVGGKPTPIMRPDPLKSAMQRVDENMAAEEDEITRQLIAGIDPSAKPRMVG